MDPLVLGGQPESGEETRTAPKLHSARPRAGLALCDTYQPDSVSVGWQERRPVAVQQQQQPPLPFLRTEGRGGRGPSGPLGPIGAQGGAHTQRKIFRMEQGEEDVRKKGTIENARDTYKIPGRVL